MRDCYPLDQKTRDRVLAEWRRYPESRPRRPASRVGDVLNRVLDDLGVGERITEEEISREWHSMVGGFLAENARPLRLRRGELAVQVLQPSIRFELERVWKPRILKRLRELYGPDAVRSLRFVLG